MIGCAMVLYALLAGSPDGQAARGLPLAGVTGPAAPLGRVGDAIEEPLPGGYPAHEQVELIQFAGCERTQAVHLSRLVSGAAQAALQVEAWLQGSTRSSPKGLEKKLFAGKGRLRQSALLARRAGPSKLRACALPRALEDWKLSASAPPGPCGKSPEGKPATDDRLFVVPLSGPLAAVVRLRPSPEGRPDRCRPRLSVLLFDEAGKGRLGYHADFGGELSIEVQGDRCQRLELVFDAASQTFRPYLKPACLPSGR